MTPLETELRDCLKGVVRILVAVRMSSGLHGNQIDRLAAAEALLARTDPSPTSLREGKR